MTADVADDFQSGQWEFTPKVVDQFDKHVRQSVPFYDVIQRAVAELSDWLAPTRTHIVDLGCATGETLRQIRDRHPKRRFTMTGYDTSADMLHAAQEKLKPHDLFVHDQPIENGLSHQDAGLTLALFTLQFLHPRDRATVLACARRASHNEGAILIAEKLRVPDSRWAEIAAELSWDHKAEAGIPAESIRSKANALRGVLMPRGPRQIVDELELAGWHGATCLFRWQQWGLYGAYASDLK